NVESFKNLKENLAEIGLVIEELPLVLQLNKRDLPSIASVDALLDTLDPDRRYEWVEAVAAKRDGVFETLTTISQATPRTLRRRCRSRSRRSNRSAHPTRSSPTRRSPVPPTRCRTTSSAVPRLPRRRCRLRQSTRKSCRRRRSTSRRRRPPPRLHRNRRSTSG